MFSTRLTVQLVRQRKRGKMSSLVWIFLVQHSQYVRNYIFLWNPAICLTVLKMTPILVKRVAPVRIWNKHPGGQSFFCLFVELNASCRAAITLTRRWLSCTQQFSRITMFFKTGAKVLWLNDAFILTFCYTTIVANFAKVQELRIIGFLQLHNTL